MATPDEVRLTQEVDQLRRRVVELEDELRQTQISLGDLDQHYATAPIGLCLVDTDLRFVRINQRLADINGRSIAEHIGHHLSEIVPQIYDFIEPIYRQVIKTGEPALNFEVEGVAPFAPNVTSTFLVSYYPVKGTNDEVVGVSCVVQDISARKQAEQAHLESEQRLRTILDNAPEAIVVFDVDADKFVDWNDNALRLFKTDGETLATLSPLELSPRVQPDGSRSDETGPILIDLAMRGDAPVFEWTHHDSTGHEIPCDIRLVRLPMSGRRLIRGSITDITERKRIEALSQQAQAELEERVAQRTAELTQSTRELERSEERLRSLIATAPDLIITIAPDGTLQYINRVTTGYNPDDIIGTSAYDYVLPEYRQAMKDAVETVFTTGEFVSLELAAMGSDGSTEWYQSRLGPFREQGEIVAVTSIATVITARKEAEERIQAEQRLLRKLLALQENERRMVAHDIHDGFVQYVVGAHMCAQGIPHRTSEQDEVRPVIEDINTYLQKAISEGRRLIRDLRPLVLDEAGIVESLTHLIADKQQHDKLSVAFEHDVQFDRLERMLEGAIFRIVQESLTNIKKHSQVSHAGVQLTQIGDMLEIVVRDQGVGFDPNEVAPDRFGLRGIRERARLFGGSATIDSSPGQGTSIQASLPLSPPPVDFEI